MRKTTLRRILEFGGIAAGAVMIAFGVGAVVLGADGRSTVHSNLEDEFIFGSDDMTPSEIAATVSEIEAAQQKIAAAQTEAGVPAEERYQFTSVSAPSCSVAGEPVDNGDRARCFAQYMRIHALSSSNGLTYAQMGRFVAKPDAPPEATDFNGGTGDPEQAVIDERTGEPASNGVRSLWVTETSLASALNLAYTADKISVFSIVVGIALLLSGIGFIILAVAVLHRNSAAVEEASAPRAAVGPT